MITIPSMLLVKNIKMKGPIFSVLTVTALIFAIDALTLASTHLQSDGLSRISLMQISESVDFLDRSPLPTRPPSQAI